MARRILIVVARFNGLITDSLLKGALETLRDAGVKDESLNVIWVPGAFEIPSVVARGARSKKYDAIITLGCVIKGETPHFDFVAGQAASGIMSISVETAIPVIFGVLTTNTVDEAMNRSGLKLGNKGREAAATALEMISTMQKI